MRRARATIALLAASLAAVHGLSAALAARVSEARCWTLHESKPAIRARLAETKVSFEFVDTPFDGALAYLSAVTEVDIRLDPRAAGSIPARVTLNMQNVPAHLALEWIVKISNLAYRIEDGAVTVAPKCFVTPDVELRFYDVQDVLAGLCSTSTYGSPAPPAEAVLVEVIQRRVAPETWDPAFGTCVVEVKKGWLLVVQTSEVHQEISELLAKFRPSGPPAAAPESGIAGRPAGR